MAVSDKKRQQLVSDASGVLHDGEEVLDVTTGVAEVSRLGSKGSRRATMLVTDRRVVIFSKKLGGYDLQDLAYPLITSVDHKKGMAFGNIDVRAAGDFVRMTQIDKAEVERVAQAIRDRMASAHSAQHQQPSAAPDIADQIRKLGELRDQGLLSAEEFDTKKADLLSRM